MRGTRAGGRGRRGRRRARPAAARRPPGRNWPRARRRSPSRTSAASVAQLPAEPARDRDAEPGLAARRDLAAAARPRTLGAARPCRGARSTFSESGSETPSSSTRVVEQRRAQLERVRHRGDVRLEQQVAGEVRADVEPLQAGDPRRRAGRAAPSAGIGSRDERRLPQLARAARPGRPPSAARSARRGATRDLEEPAGAVRARARLAAAGPAQRARGRAAPRAARRGPRARPRRTARSRRTPRRRRRP